MYKSGNLGPKIDPNVVCCSHCRKTGFLLEADLGIFTTMLKGEMCGEKYLSMETGIWNFSSMRESMALALSEITDIRNDYDIYTEKALWGC